MIALKFFSHCFWGAQVLSPLFLWSAFATSGNFADQVRNHPDHWRVWQGLLHDFDQDGISDLPYPSDFFVSAHPNRDQDTRDPGGVFRELVASLDQMHSESFQCGFPARTRVFLNWGFLKPADLKSCPNVDLLLKGVEGKGIVYVYSSAYPGNPASMFGHTFVRIDRKKNDPLRDYGVNFAAVVPEGEIGLVYVPLGLLGLYPGRFEIGPYYQKVLEYTHAESRDLWEVDLGFSEEETDLWIRHFHELRFKGRYSYGFLFRNCSYELIQSLRAIRPELDVLPTASFYLLPGRTFKRVVEQYPRLSETIKFRPSLYKVAQHRWSQLTEEQTVTAREVLVMKNPELIAQVSAPPESLEAVMSQWEYDRVEGQKEKNEEWDYRLDAIRRKRARLGGTTRTPPVPSPDFTTNRPDLAHESRKIAFTGGGDSASGWYGVRARLGLHDFLNDDHGYETEFSVTGFDVEIQKRPDHNVRLRRFDLARMESIQAIRGPRRPYSWGVSLGWVPDLFFSRNQNVGEFAPKFMVSPSGGFTFLPIPDRLWVGLMGRVIAHHQGHLGYLLEPFSLIRLAHNFKAEIRLPSGFDWGPARHDFVALVKMGIAYGIQGRFELRAEMAKSSRSTSQLELSVGMFF